MTKIIPAGDPSARQDDREWINREQVRRPDLGTLLWIGPRDSVYFRDAYDFCDESVAQIAFRRNAKQALDRPSAGVNAIVMCLENDSTSDRATFLTLCHQHGRAEKMLLLGPMCSGKRPHPSELYRTVSRYWHEWETFLPTQLIRCGLKTTVSRRPNSIVVVAADHANASALMTIASAGNAPAMTVRPHQVSLIENVDQYWWDDSATTTGDWQTRLSQRTLRQSQHVWLTSMLTPKAKQLAVEAGVDLVLTKPGDLSQLIRRVECVLPGSHRSVA